MLALYHTTASLSRACSCQIDGVAAEGEELLKRIQCSLSVFGRPGAYMGP